MGLIVPTTIHPEREDQPRKRNKSLCWYVSFPSMTDQACRGSSCWLLGSASQPI